MNRFPHYRADAGGCVVVKHSNDGRLADKQADTHNTVCEAQTVPESWGSAVVALVGYMDDIETSLSCVLASPRCNL